MKKAEYIFRAAVFLVCAGGLVWFLIPLLWNVLNIGNACGLCVCAALMAGSLFFGKIREACLRSRVWRGVFLAADILLCAGAAWTIAMTCCMFSAAASTPPENSTVVVLGSLVSGTKPSADLQSRIDTAAVYLKEHPGTVCVASGGQGPREGITEAEAIKKTLVSAGVEPARVLLEDQSRSTRENLRNSLAVIKKAGGSQKLAIVTDDYHEFRACSIARSLGLEAYAVPARTPWFILSSCWAREVLALAKYLLIPV